MAFGRTRNWLHAHGKKAFAEGRDCIYMLYIIDFYCKSAR